MHGSTRLLAVLFGFLVSAVGLLSLWSWALVPGGLRFLSFAQTHLEFDAAICLVAAGLSLVLATGSDRPAWLARTARIPAVVPIVFGLATLAEHLLGVDFGIDRSFLHAFPGAPAAALVRMGPAASVSFALVGLALLLFDGSPKRSCTACQSIAVAVIVIMIVPVVSFVFGVNEPYGLAHYTDVALVEAAALLLLAVGILAARPDAGLSKRFLAADTGGMMLRRLIPAAVVLPIVLLRLHLIGEQAGLYRADFGRSMLIVIFIVLFSTLIFLTAAALQRHTAARLRAEAAERDLRDKLAASLESERAARAIAERSNYVKDEFLATLSHELRTPLSAITGWVQLLQSGVLEPAEQAKALETIHRNSRLQAQLIEELLEMSRIEAGTLRIELRDVDLVSVIESAVVAAAPAAQAADLTLESTVSAGRVIVHGDPARLQQIIANLIGNAVKFTPAGGRITVSTGASDGWAHVAVSDTGIGIGPEFLSHVFDRFRQADGSTTRKHGGLGLGLSIAQQLAIMHGGSIAAHSAGEGCGSTFTLRLPTTALQERPAPGAADPIANVATRLDGLHVLVVDDQPDSCQLAERMLMAYGAHVTTVLSVEHALRALEAGRFDVLVSDIGMPGRDGYDLIAEVRARDLALPAIALTAFARTLDVERALAAGYQAHLSKPVTPDRLAQEVAQALGARIQNRETGVAH